MNSSDRSEAHEGVMRSAGVVGSAVTLSRLTGLLREIVFARLFGAGGGIAYDAYVGAFRIPNLLRDLFGEGALSAAFVAVFSKTLAEQGESAAHRLANRLTTLLVPMLAALCLLGIAFAPGIVDFMFPGFSEVEGKRELTILMTRVMAPFLLFIALAARSMGVLNARGLFGIPALASACFNVVSLAAGLFVAFGIGPAVGMRPIVGMAVGAVIGGAAQYLWQTPSLRGTGLRYRPDFNFRDPAMREIFRLMGPAVIGAAAMQVNIVVNSQFASRITDVSGQVIDGPVSWLSYAFRFMQLPLGVFGVAIASATLPAVSRSAAGGRIDEFRDLLSRSLRMVFVLTIPAAIGLIALSRVIVGVVYERGRFTAHDTEQTAAALAYYCLGLTAYAATKTLTSAFYALGDVRVPMVASLISIGVNYGLNWTFLNVLGWSHEGLAFATSLVAGLNFAILFAAMRRRIAGLQGRSLSVAALKIGAASLAMGLAIHALSQGMGEALGPGFWPRLAILALCVPAGMAVVYGLGRALRVPELDSAEQTLRDRLGLRRTG